MNYDILVPQRLETETQSEYRNRQKDKSIVLKQQKRGKLIWDSYSNGQYRVKKV